MQTVLKFTQVINDVVINPIMALLFTLALLLFFYGGLSFFLSEDGGEGRKHAKDNMLYGVIGMLIMVSVTAILGLFLRTFGVTQADIPPDLPFRL